MADKSTIIQVILAVFASRIAASLYGSFYTDFYNIPFLKLDVLHRENDENYTTQIQNIGSKPASKVYLTLVTPSHINESDYFSTENITVVEISDTILQGYTPRISEGNGAKITFNITLESGDGKNHSKEFEIFATYDEESNYFGQKVDILHSIIFFLNQNPDIYLIIVIIGLVLIFSSLLFIYFIWRRSDRQFQKSVNNEIFQIYIQLKDDSYDVKPFCNYKEYSNLDPIRPTGLHLFLYHMKASRWREENLDTKRRCFPNFRIYILIDRFYIKVKERDDHLENAKNSRKKITKDDVKFFELNEHTSELSEEDKERIERVRKLKKLNDDVLSSAANTVTKIK